MTTKKQTIDKKDDSGIVQILWIAAIAAILMASAMFVLIALTQMPDTGELENPKFEESSVIYSSDMQELGKYYVKNRELVLFEELNPYLVKALIATEDERFYKHSGIDLRGTIRAVVYMGRDGGASTITQQLAKLFFVNRSRSTIKRIWQKLKEWTIAVQFEKRYTKEEIIAMYLNKAEFPYNSFGIGAASETFFGVSQDKLSLDQAAILIGMLKSPYYYNPKSFPDNAMKRRNVVLKQMLRNRTLTNEEYAIESKKEIDNSAFKNSVHYNGIATYFRFELTKWLKDILEEGASLKADGTKYDIYSDGLKIYTTIDYRMQNHAEEAMKVHMAELQKKYFDYWKGKDPWTYKADKSELESRKADFNRTIRETERYKSLRQLYLSEVINQISEEVSDTRWNDIDILRMVRENADKGHLAGLVQRKTITKSQSRTYKEIMSGPYWETLLSQWRKLEEKSKREFSTKREMQVFAYNEAGEKTVSMTPLDSVRYHAMHMQMGSMAVEPSTGHIKTWVGGIGNKYFQFDHVNIRGQRQVGSTFKPFIYATAVQNLAMSPCRRVADSRYSINAGEFGLVKSWSPENADGKFTNEELTLKEGLRLSRNSITVWLLKQFGNVDVVKDLVEKMGIKRNRLANGPAIALGASNLSLMEMTGAYTTFANNGVYTEPIMVTRIEDNNGRVIYNATSSQQRALSETTNYAMVDMLKYATKNHSYQLKTEFGGKTGTTNDFVDGWFMGVMPNLVVGTWVGGEKKWIKFNTSTLGYGGVMARPYFFEFMKKVENDKKIAFDINSKFFIPEEMELELDCSKYDALYHQDAPAVEEFMDEEFEDEF